jgi:hypothetical protein
MCLAIKKPLLGVSRERETFRTREHKRFFFTPLFIASHPLKLLQPNVIMLYYTARIVL